MIVSFKTAAVDWARAVRSQAVSASDFGVVGDGVADDTAALQAMLDKLEISNGVTECHVAPGRYKITHGLIIPQDVPERCCIRAYGARIFSGQPIKLLSKQRPTDQTNALTYLRTGFHIEGLSLEGLSAQQQASVGFEFSAFSGLSLRDCRALFCETGFDLIFCLNSVMETCYTTQCSVDGFVARSGNSEWAGASLTNSQSNHTKFINCNSYASQGAQSQFKILASSGVELIGCVTEGLNPIDAVFFDDQNTTTVRTFRVVNHHAENSPTNSVFRVRLLAGVAVLEHVYHQGNPVTLVDARECSFNARIDLARMSYIQPGSKLRASQGNAPRWYLSSRGDIYANWAEPENWVDGIVGQFIEVGANNENRLGMYSSWDLYIEGRSIRLTPEFDKIYLDGDLCSSKVEDGVTLGSVVKRLAIHDDDGNLVGFAPIYDAIL